MRVAVITSHGEPESISFEERPVPTPSDSQCLIRVRACGLNHLDTWVRRGVPGHKFPLPLVPGSDITGVIDRVGPGAKRFRPGDRVIVNPGISCGHCTYCHSNRDHLCAQWGLLGETTDGGCQEFVTIPEGQIYALPPSLSFEHGACVPINYVTAWQMLVEKAHVRPGESILIHGAGGGVSIACIMIAKLYGMQIFVTSSSDEKLARARIIGAHRFINTSKEPFRDAIRNLTNKQGVDVVVDHVGEATFMDSVRCLRKGGRLVSCGATTGADLKIDWKHVFFKNIALHGSTYGPKGDFCEVLKQFENNKLASVVDHTIKLDELPKAHAAIESRKVFGKIVVVF